jgi:acetate kinase
MTLLTINTGSSSVRLAAHTDDLTRLANAHHIINGEMQATPLLAEFLRRPGVGPIVVVAHRIVHGGERLTAPCRIDAAVEAEIERLSPLAPLHNPFALAWIRACHELLGADLPQVAVFDTGFYADLPAVARTYALPRALAERRRLRRYGFHGLAHQAMWRRWQVLQARRPVGARVISLQLGAGCSITAIRDGKAVDTSMGFSPLEGLVMATRAGDVDPGLLLYLQRAEGMTPERLEKLLNEESGLLGVSGASSDMRALLTSSDPQARLAVDLYCYRARKYIGAYLATLGGADAILFGGGVGEHAPAVRAKILDSMQWAGIVLDAARNDAAIGTEARISDLNSKVEVWVVPVDEAVILAQAAQAVLGQAAPTKEARL